VATHHPTRIGKLILFVIRATYDFSVCAQQGGCSVKGTKIMFRLVLLVGIFGILSAQVRGQNAGGRVVGTVYDQQGAVIPGASVTVTNTATQVGTTSVTDKDGFFQVLDLPVGSYHVAVEHQGFDKIVTQDKKLEINQSLRFDITLTVGSTNQVVTVEAKVSGVETVDPTLGQVVSSRAIQDLPLNGRDVLTLALLQPGVTEANPDYTGATTASGTAFSVGGGRPDSITYLLDGGLNNNLLDNSNVLDPNPDAIQEFRILTSDYTAEYGRNGAGVISVVTKSGTNSIHGSAYDYLRNTDFDANDYFNKQDGQPRDDLKRNQYGATLGGPIIKDRIFWFVSYQGQRQTQGVTSLDIPTFTAAELQGNFSQAVPNGGTVVGPTGNNITVTCANPQCPDPNVAAFLQANPFFQSNPTLAAQAIIDPTKINPVSANYIGLGVIPTSPTGLFSSSGSSTNNNNELTGKMDFVVTPKDRISTTIGGFRNPTLAPFPFGFGANVPGFPTTSQLNNYFGSVAYIRDFTPNFLNELRFTAQRNHLTQNVPATKLPIPSALGFGISPDLPDGPPQLNFDTGLNLGYNGEGPSTLVNNTFALADTITWVRGHNTWKFGAGVSAYQNNQVFNFFGNGDFSFEGFGAGGIATGNSFADFLLALPNNNFEGPNATSNIRSKSTYGFFQDEWRVRKNLTLTLGIRYEYSSPKSDTQGRTFDIIPGHQSTRFPNAPLSLVYPGDAGAPSGVNFPVKNNWAPRVGFAWDPWGTGKTSVRGGFGIFYDILKAEDNFQFNGAPPFFSEATAIYPSPVNAQSPFFSDPWTSAGFPANPFPSVPPTKNISFANFLPLGINGIFLVNPHLHTPYTYQYNLSIQRELAKNLIFEISYVGSSSKGLTALEDINPFVLGTTTRVLNINQPSPTIQAICANSGNDASDCPFSALPAFSNVGFANYNSLEASLTRQLYDSHFFGTTYFTLAYTYGRAIDNSSGFQNRTFQVPFYNINQFRGAADYDVQDRIVFSGGWDLPFDRMWKSGSKLLTKGWSLYPIVSWRTGFPLSIPGNFSIDPSLPGPSGAGDGPLASASFSPGFNHITIVDPKTNGNTYFVTEVNNQPVFQSAGTPGAPPYGLPRNFFYGPGRTNFDLALAKTTTFHERYGLQFRVEAFNLLNHAEFSNPDVNIADFGSTFGQITNTVLNSERILQLALRFTF
jgi:Carboxypeptidase regulatory-like domain/TonB dependent receptor